MFEGPARPGCLGHREQSQEEKEEEGVQGAGVVETVTSMGDERFGLYPTCNTKLLLGF